MEVNKFMDKIKVTFVIMVLFFSTSTVWAATYYVDFENGSDSNNGVAISTPFKHSPGDSNDSDNAALITLSAGDVVVFKKGVSYKSIITTKWSGALVASGSTATITKEGVLKDLSANFITNGVSTSDYIYIYHSKESQTNTWVESTGLFRIASIDSEDQITLSDFNGKAHSIAEMTYGIVNPITYKSIEGWGTGDAVFDGENIRPILINLAGQNFVRIDSLKFINTYDSGTYWRGAITSAALDLSYRVGSADWLQVVNSKFENLGINSISIYPSNYVVVKGNYAKNVAFNGVGGGTKYSLEENNTIYGPGTRCGLGGKKFTIIRNNYCKDMTIQYQTYHQDGIGYIDGGVDGDAWYGWIYGNVIDNTVEFLALYETGGGTKYWTIHSNVFIGRIDDTGFGDAAILMRGSEGNKIFNNLFLGVKGKGFINAIRMDRGNINTEIKNNIFYNSGGASAIININSDSIGGLNIDFNHYYNSCSNCFWYDGANITFDEWKALGFDRNGIANMTTNPKFISPNTFNFHLSSKSPDIDKGEDLYAYFTIDKDGNPRPYGSGWDIGAYEYGKVAPSKIDTLKIVK